MHEIKCHHCSAFVLGFGVVKLLIILNSFDWLGAHSVPNSINMVHQPLANVYHPLMNDSYSAKSITRYWCKVSHCIIWSMQLVLEHKIFLHFWSTTFVAMSIIFSNYVDIALFYYSYLFWMHNISILFQWVMVTLSLPCLCLLSEYLWPIINFFNSSIQDLFKFHISKTLYKTKFFHEN